VSCHNTLRSLLESVCVGGGGQQVARSATGHPRVLSPTYSRQSSPRVHVRLNRYVGPTAPPIGEALPEVSASATSSSRAVEVAFASNEHLLASGMVTMLCGHKHNVYSIASCPGIDLVAGGGKSGFVTFYPTSHRAPLASMCVTPLLFVEQILCSIVLHSVLLCSTRFSGRELFHCILLASLVVNCSTVFYSLLWS
jgi:hypothetical protein